MLKNWSFSIKLQVWIDPTSLMPVSQQMVAKWMTIKRNQRIFTYTPLDRAGSISTLTGATTCVPINCWDFFERRRAVLIRCSKPALRRCWSSVGWRGMTWDDVGWRWHTANTNLLVLPPHKNLLSFSFFSQQPHLSFSGRLKGLRRMEAL